MDNKNEIEKGIANWAPFVKFLKAQWNADVEEQEQEEDFASRDRIWKSVHKGIQPKQSIRKPLYRRLKIAVAIAATVLLCVFGGRILLEQTPFSGVEEGKFRVVKASGVYLLPDSSQVWMEKGSEIHFSEDFLKDRKVWLQGNAIFDVTKQKGNYFRVYLCNSYIEVKGTSFSVKQDDAENTAITLYSGRVDFVPENSQHRISLLPSQRAIYNKLNESVRIEQFSKTIAWENGSYKFTQTELSEISEFITCKYGHKVELDNIPLTKSRVTGSIRFDENIESVLDKISFSLNLKYKQIEDNYIIYE